MFYEERGVPVKLIGLNYGDELDFTEIDKDTIVYMVDYTHCEQKADPKVKAWPMFSIRDLARSFIWLDHHSTSLADVARYAEANSVEPYFDGFQTNKFSGTELTWLYLFADEPMKASMRANTLEPTDPEYLLDVPRLIYLLGRYDVWNKEHKNWDDIVSFQYGIRLMGELKPEDDSAYERFWKEYIKDKHGFFSHIETGTTKNGEVIVKYNAIQNDDYISRHGYECDLYVPSEVFDEGPVPAPFRFFAMNTGEKGSALFNSLEGKYDAFLAYAHDGTKTNVSIYSFDTVKCNAAELCTRLGGGGHPGAAGFVITDGNPLPFKRIS
jgi:oligoribonuclease NrnB/cAMP/cGMP phosphodiesterase (DHH superfamily)